MAIEYRSPKSVKPTNPFINGSSGSKWGLAELQWLRVDLRPDIPVRGHLLEWIPARGGRTDRSLQLELGRSWSDLQDFEIRKTSSLYSALYEISKPILPPEPQSSPITSTPKSSRSLHGSLIGSSPPLDPRSPSISLQQARELRKRSNPVDYHESQQSSSPNGTDSGNVRVSSSPESDYNASDDEMQYQKESYIQEAARAFVKVLRDITIELTKLDKPENHQMNAETRKFTIAGKSISTLPDGCWRTLNRSYNDVILEVKRKKPSSNKSDILGQEVCHLLSLAFEHRLRQPRKEYSVSLPIHPMTATQLFVCILLEMTLICL